ncbi:MAG: hypothetical protein Q7R93_00085 [bacterium]|nr:hypothetical protein [bacterium]
MVIRCACCEGDIFPGDQVAFATLPVEGSLLPSSVVYLPSRSVVVCLSRRRCAQFQNCVDARWMADLPAGCLSVGGTLLKGSRRTAVLVTRENSSRLQKFLRK